MAAPKFALVALLFAFLAASALAQTCDISGTTWESSNATTSIEFNSDGTYTSESDIELTQPDDTECDMDFTIEGTWTLSENDLLTTNTTSCDITCSDDCATCSDCPSGDTSSETLAFATDCNSFTLGGVTYEKQNSNLWVWLLVAVAVVGCIGLIAVAGVGGFLVYKKRQAASGSTSYDDFA
mmetsp:Transcript_14219/g.55992  ORF Transcript_14219/g.55992 Transcript_14219/m.55992 type:complete len:182 (-) Transcript_14219:66-611(-)|eukprot:CAMPEP_0114612400 /NCGR_PEP_ID=MMETSP0168-20121206/4602_1 /TAXON_ID=95228 ORGANISM="Vannella sp., Strain DIVA3 517/6/12" /NCGR_SAMPLE_ID=MMETSP0168 /ASSEMBLY_ACC=CAM_ASM_000044 /LENGTH=181 /DNA_ID=CAMNT_0001823383 /DNA_START=52 /DNA_END=597 /DNA_ORIENTATION=-